jgi:hypothetical protein
VPPRRIGKGRFLSGNEESVHDFEGGGRGGKSGACYIEG